MRSPASAFDLRAAMTEEIRAALGELEAAPAKAKAVHRCRVRLKRARALARLGRACAPGLAAAFNQSARTAMRALAPERDLAASAGAARRLARKSGGKSAAALAALAHGLDCARAALAPPNPDFASASLKDLLALAQVWPQASARQIAKGAHRLARRARRARRRGRIAGAPARRHEWRKCEKDRLYTVTLLGKTWPQRRKRRRKQSKQLSLLLGRERDALLLIERVTANPALAGSAQGGQRALKALKRHAERLARRANAAGAKLHAGGA